MSFNFLYWSSEVNPGTVVNMYQGSSWPGGTETPQTAMPSIVKSPHPFLPTPISFPSLFPVYNDFETSTKRFEVSLEQLCGLECIIMLCLNYNILWLMWMAGTARIQT